MFLSALNVENFRGVRRGHLSFGETTVLIGENDCGKSSLLDALARVLDAPDAGPPEFEAQHFYRTAGPSGGIPAGPIRIELVFRERHAGEWDAPELAALGPLPTGRPPGPRQVSLQVTAQPPADDGLGSTDWEIRVPGAKGPPSRNDPALLAAVRALNPLIQLRGGLISFAAPSLCPPAASPDTPAAEVEALARDVEAHYQALIAGASPQLERSSRRASRRPAHCSSGGRSRSTPEGACRGSPSPRCSAGPPTASSGAGWPSTARPQSSSAC